MTMFEEPQIVDLDEILDEQESPGARVTGIQWALVVGGGIIGIAGLLTVLVVAAPALIDLVSWINSIQHAVSG